MKIFTVCVATLAASWLFISSTQATGVLPETSIVIIEEEEGEGAINLKNTDATPVLLLSTLQDIEHDRARLLTITPPVARVEAGKTQRVRFLLTNKAPLKTERLKRVIFEGVPPQKKDDHTVHMTIRQNLPVLIRPAGLPRDDTPWKKLVWTVKEGVLNVDNPSPYVVRLGQGVTTLPDRTTWNLPQTYILPGQHITLTSKTSAHTDAARQVRLSPATTWGFTVDSYDAPLSF